jgi:hypothetical protein
MVRHEFVVPKGHIAKLGLFCGWHNIDVIRNELRYYIISSRNSGRVLLRKPKEF